MTVSSIDPGAALIVIDLQKGLAGAVPPGVTERASRLARAFREHGLPVVLVNVTGGAAGRTEVSRPSRDRQLPEDFAELMASRGPRWRWPAQYRRRRKPAGYQPAVRNWAANPPAGAGTR